MAAHDISPVTLTLVRSALQQRAASAAPLDQAARVCLLMHVGVAQASTRMEQERPFVSTVEQVRSDAAGAACHALLPNLVSVRISEEDARREYM